MSNPSGPALLVAVTHAVREAVMARPAKNQSGPEFWPQVAKVMNWLAGLAGDRNYWRKRYKRTAAGLSEVALGALVASVDPETYREAVGTVLETGEEPGGSLPALPRANVHQEPSDGPVPEVKQPHKGKRRQLTVEELDALTPEAIFGMADADVRIEQAEAKSRVYKRLYDQAKKRAAFVATACGMLQDIVQTLEPIPWDPGSIPAVHIKRAQEAVLLLSDIHIGDEIHSDTMGALNIYNFSVFQDKLRRLYAGVKESLEVLQEYGPVRRLRIFGLGDWVTGTNIFPGQTHHIEFGAMQQALKGADEMAEFYRNLLELPGIESVDGESVPGNHGRPGRKGADPFEDNWDCVMYEFLRLRLAAEKRISIAWHPSWWMMPDVLGWNFLCAHGDEVKGWGGIPSYGFRRWGSRWRELLDGVGKRYDYGIIGHHHTEVEERNLIISGAWPGASFFSAKELQSGGEATQMFYSVSEDRGIVWRRRLPLDPPRRPVMDEAG